MKRVTSLAAGVFVLLGLVFAPLNLCAGTVPPMDEDTVQTTTEAEGGADGTQPGEGDAEGGTESDAGDEQGQEGEEPEDDEPMAAALRRAPDIEVDNFADLEREVAAAGAVPTVIYITGDIEFPAVASVASIPYSILTIPTGADITLCARGGDWTLIGEDPAGRTLYLTMIGVQQSAKLAIAEEPGASLTLDAQNSYSGTASGYSYRGIIYTLGELVIEGGTFQNFNSASQYTAGVLVRGSAARLELRGGTIQVCVFTKAQDFAPVLLLGGAHMEMYEGSMICDNKAMTRYNYSAGGVMLFTASRFDRQMCTFTMYGGTITRNEGYTGGVLVHTPELELFDGYTANHEFVMEGGRITDNVGWHGGGVFAFAFSTFVMRGGTIADNTAAMGGGIGVYNYYKDIELQYSGLYTGQQWDQLVPTRFEMSGGSVTGNRARPDEGYNDPAYGGDGGGIYIAAWRADISNVLLEANTATKSGGRALCDVWQAACGQLRNCGQWQRTGRRRHLCVCLQ